MSRTFSYVASVLSTPSRRRNTSSFLDTQSPSKRRRIMSNDTEILEPNNDPYSLTTAPTSSSRLPSFFANHSISQSSSNDMDTGPNEGVFPILLSQDPAANPLPGLSQSYQIQSLSRRDSITSFTSQTSSSSEEHIHPQLSSPNQRVDPSIAESHLRSIGILVHHPTNVVVCIQCCSGVLAENAFAHITSALSKCRNQAWLTLSAHYVDNCLRACGAFNPVKLPLSAESIAPIPIIPVLDGWVCKVDPFLKCFQLCFASKRTRERHFHDMHPDITERCEHYADTKLQTIYNFRGDQRCIRVHLVPPKVNPPRYDAFISSFADGDPLPDSKPASLITQQTVFESITKWDTALDGVDIGVIKKYSRPPYVDAPEYDSLTELIVEYITTTVADNVKNGGHRQLLQQVHSPEA